MIQGSMYDFTANYLKFGARFQLSPVSIPRHARNLRTTPRHNKNRTDMRHEFFFITIKSCILNVPRSDKIAQTAVWSKLNDEK